MNIEIFKVACTAFKTVYKTMSEGERKHPGNEWKHLSKREQKRHIGLHLYFDEMSYAQDEDHIGHALTRLAMLKRLNK